MMICKCSSLGEKTFIHFLKLLGVHSLPHFQKYVHKFWGDGGRLIL